MRAIEFRVPGIPRPQGSKQVRMNRRNGKAYLQESAGGRLKAWRNAVAMSARLAMGGDDPCGVDVAVECIFAMPNRRRVDVDKLLRAAFDALTGVVFDDDCRVADVWARKVISERAGAKFFVYPLTTAEAQTALGDYSRAVKGNHGGMPTSASDL